jgi:hypothetical protein
VTDASGAVLKPGRPIANPGPDRVVATLSTQLSAKYSLYADSYAWSVTGASGASATVFPANGLTTTFTAPADGTYHVQLIASKGGVKSEPFDLTLVVNSTAWPATILSGTVAVSNPVPTDITFEHIDAYLNNHGCANSSCHSIGTTKNPPIFYNKATDRNGDGLAEGAVGQTDYKLLYSQLLSFVNLSDPAGSELLRHPAGNGHGGGLQTSFHLNNGSTTSLQIYLPGDTNRSGYDLFLNWILNGAPSGF